MTANIMYRNEIEPLISALVDEEGPILRLVIKFIDKLPATLVYIRQLYEDGELGEFSSNIHNLKGTAGNFGFTEITKVAEDIEKRVNEKNTADINAQLNLLDSLHERIEEGRKYYNV